MTVNERNRLTVGVIGTLLTTLATSATAERPKYRVEPYEVYPGPRIVWSLPMALNNQNVACGRSEGPMEARATRWHPDETVVGLDYSIFPRANALAINESNWTAGLSYYLWDMWQAVVWAPDGSATVLGGLWQSYEGLSEVRGLNDFSVAAGVSSSDDSLARAFRWTAETGMEDIGSLGGPRAVATAINNQGTIVGYSDTADIDTHAFIYRDGDISPLGLLPGGTLAEALDINEQGVVVGGADTGAVADEPLLRFHAVLWDESSPGLVPAPPLDLGVPFPGGQSYAVAINEAGQVVGNGENPEVPGDYYFPWIWEDGQMKLLQGLIPPDTDWILYQVTDINDNGWIVGNDAYGRAQGFVLIPLQDGDMDYDGDVDLSDHAAFANCLTGPAGGVPVDCISADIDEDADVDLRDFAKLARAYGLP